MKLVTFSARGNTMLGAIQGKWIVDLSKAGEWYFSARGSSKATLRPHVLLPSAMTEFLAGGDEAIEVASEAVSHTRALLSDFREVERLEREGILWPQSEARLLPPIPRPPKILCVGNNYRKPAGTTATELPRYPTFFGRFAHTLLAPGAPFVLPSVSEQVDYEGELAAVIGRGGQGIPASRALEHVAGYTIFNEISVRDFQKRTSQWFIGKNFDKSGPMGPALVTRDEVADPQALTLAVDVSGERLQEAETSTMIFSVAELVAYLSDVMTLEPGDLIVTGTPSGVGANRTPPRWLRAGDTVRVTISRLGVLETPILAAAVTGSRVSDLTAKTRVE